MLFAPRRLTTFRPLTDNDRGAGHGFERAQWTVAGRYARCANVAVEQPSDDSVAVTYTYELATPLTPLLRSATKHRAPATCE